MVRDEIAVAARRRPSLGAAVLALLVILIAALTVIVSPGTAPVAGPSDEAATERARVVRELLSARSAAVATGDAQRWLSTLDPRAGQFAASQSALLPILTALPRASWAYTHAGYGPALSPERTRVLGSEAFVARVRLTYRLAGIDEREVQRDQYLTFARRDGRWRIAGNSDAPQGRSAQADPWDLGEVALARGRSSLVLARPGPSGLVATDLTRLADRAVEQVRELWPQPWPQRVVVIVPADLPEMARLVGAHPATATAGVTAPASAAEQLAGLTQIAAVTTGQAVGQGGPTVGNRIVLNPTAFARLTETGRQVVLTHEATHVATRSLAGSSTPIWLSEGFADYVAYRGSGLDVAGVAGETLDQVRSGPAPDRLPRPADFDPGRASVAASYSSAWLAAVQIARRHGEGGLVEFYLAAATQPSDGRDGAATEAFRTVLGTSEAEFVALWRQFLVDLAADAGESTRDDEPAVARAAP